MKKIIIFILILITSTYLLKTYFSLKKITSSNEIYKIYVNKNEKIKKSNLKKLKIGYLNQDESSKEYSSNLNYIPFDDLNMLFSSLRTKEIGAMILDSELAIKLEKDLVYFKELDQFEIKNKDTANSKKQFTLYISGTDTYSNSSSRSDVNILLSVNLDKNKILISFIPRDYFIPFLNSKDKLTHISTYGIDKTITSLSNFLDIDIDYYLKIDFNGFIDIIDLLGGIDVYSDTSFISKDGYKFIKGSNKMFGKQALSFVRERYAFNEGDKKRGVNQQEVIKSLINKISSSEFLFSYGKFLKIVSNNVKTNINEKTILSLIKNGIKSFEISTYNFDGVDSYEYTYTYPHEKLYVMVPLENNFKNIVKDVIGE